MYSKRNFIYITDTPTLLTGGALAAFSASIDVIILKIKSYIKRNAKAQAVVY
ncbi:MAG: uberolysin/carnocyclin family circular bacteriocin [Streptococcaceae bacterium]|jgi:circularin A/uberolysin family circular bacteriocin|nr:uberolysin/carnocyclin family circular bacteriocin [Streptococcaceae bacterium]